MMGEMALGNAAQTRSTVTTGTAMDSPKRIAREKSDKRPKIEEPGAAINTCSDSSPTDS
jgi:hypothetical protein